MSEFPSSNNTPPATRNLGTLMMALAWLVFFILLVAYFQQEEEQQFNPNQDLDTLTKGDKKSVILKANRNNHFVMTGKINGKKVPLILDTGATNVAIPANMAKELGLSFGAEGIAMTANGDAVTYATTIDKLELGEMVLYNVPAELGSGMDNMKGILLGMSALSQLEFSQRDGFLTLSQ